MSNQGGVWPVVAQARDLRQQVRAIAVPTLGSGDKALQDHRAILEALQSGNVDAAVAKVSQHIRHNEILTQRVAQLLHAYFDQPVAINCDVGAK